MLPQHTDRPLLCAVCSPLSKSFFCLLCIRYTHGAQRSSPKTCCPLPRDHQVRGLCELWQSFLSASAGQILSPSPPAPPPPSDLGTSELFWWIIRALQSSLHSYGGCLSPVTCDEGTTNSWGKNWWVVCNYLLDFKMPKITKSMIL